MSETSARVSLPQEHASTEPRDDVLLIGGPHHLTSVRFGKDGDLPPSVRPVALPDAKPLAFLFPVRVPREGQWHYVFSFSNNCYTRTTIQTTDGRTLYSWIDKEGIPDPTPPELLAAGIVKVSEGCYANPAALARALF
jgi:hypothetical protein